MESRIFAIGDIHGCYKTLKNLMNRFRPTEDDLLIFLGDYIDRGSRVKETIDYLIALKEQGFQANCLMGNHEWMLLETYENQINEQIWHFNGADSTLRSFGISKIAQLDKKYLQFFQDLELFKEIGGYLFVHAGFNDNGKYAFTDIQSNLWSRNEQYSDPVLKSKTIIHGHTPTTIEELRYRINNSHKVLNLDTGCVYGHRNGLGYLTALEIPSFTIYSEKNCD